MTTINIESPHGCLKDADGRVVLRFGNWSTGSHDVPDAVETVDYVDGAAAHSEAVHWRYVNGGVPPVDLSLSSQSVINDGSDSVDVRMTLDPDAETARDVTLSVDGSEFSETLDPGDETVETITTTQTARSTINITVDGPDVQRETATVEVVSA